MLRTINKSKAHAVPLLIGLNVALLVSLLGVAVIVFRSPGTQTKQTSVQTPGSNVAQPSSASSSSSPPPSAAAIQPPVTNGDNDPTPGASTAPNDPDAQASGAPATANDPDDSDAQASGAPATAGDPDEPATGAPAEQAEPAHQEAPSADADAEPSAAADHQDPPPADTNVEPSAAPDHQDSPPPAAPVEQPPAPDSQQVSPSQQRSAVQPAETFTYTFDGAPAQPQPWQPTDWDVTVHSRDTSTWNTLEPMAANHGPDCGAPPATHPVSAYEQAVFQCKDHVMTAINASGYGAIYLTPNRMVDFSQGEAVVRFDMSTLRTSNRDWVDVWITPYQDNLQLPLENWLPDLQGPPRNAIQIRMDNAAGGTYFRVTVYRNFGEEELPRASEVAYETVLTPDAARRDTFELRLSQNRITFGMPNYNLWWVDAQVAPLGWDMGVVQFGHHSYNPAKAEECALGCKPDTWHWDNVQIAPARPFTIIRAAQRQANAAQDAISFPQGAPADARLRFAGIGNNLEVSFDDGATWQAAQKQAQQLNNEFQFSSYWTPIPAGASTVRFRGQGVTADGWLVRDLSIWSLNK